MTQIQRADRGGAGDSTRVESCSTEIAVVRILLVEDDASYARFVQGLFSSVGGEGEQLIFDVTHVGTLAAALQSRAQDFDLILLDLGLPDSRGLESLVRVRESTPETPVVVLSGLQDEALSLDSVRHGAHDYLVKTVVHAKMLVRVVRYAIERKRAQEQLDLVASELQQLTTDLALKNRELEKKNEEMENFVYTVSHDLKSPLVTTKGFIGVLREDLESGETSALMDSLERIERAANCMSRMIEDLLKLSRAGRVRNQPEPVDITALVREVAADLQTRLEDSGVEMEVQDAMPKIVVDRSAIARVFENLLSNALKYGSKVPNPKLVVGCERVDGEERIFMKDNGPGIPSEHHQKIFGLFQRLESDQDGTGIGLAVVEKIMRAHNGRVWVESSPGNGATFWLTFPLSSQLTLDLSRSASTLSPSR